MPNISRSVAAAGFRSIQALKLTKLLSRSHAGLGVIFMLHRVSPEAERRPSFAPNRYLSVTPDYLLQTIEYVRTLDMDIVSMDAVAERIANPSGKRFAVFTLDDGYRDNLEHAYPVFKQSHTPFTVNIPAAWPDGHGTLWSLILETVIAANQSIETGITSMPARFPCHTASQKNKTFWALDSYLDGIPDHQREVHMAALAANYNVDKEKLCRDNIMNWEEIRLLASDKLVTIGAHSVTHRVLKDLSPCQLENELVQSRNTIERELNQVCRHFAFPYGDTRSAGRREIQAAQNAGYTTAVTTSSRPVHASDRENLFSLPRIALDGTRQNLATLDVQLSGLPQALRALTK